MNMHWCRCGGEVSAGGKAPAGGGECLACGAVYEDAAAVSRAGGGSAIICGGRGRRRPALCQVEGCRAVGVALCDEPVGSRRTCDRLLCSRHATSVGRNRERCPEHAPQQRLVP